MEKKSTITDLGNGEKLISKGNKETMLIKDEKTKKINYFIIKIGDKIYSTIFGEKAFNNGCKATIKKAITQGIGEEEYLRIRGHAQETNGHKRLDNPIPVELDIYSDFHEENPSIVQSELNFKEDNNK